MKDPSLLSSGRYSLDWVKPFYDRTAGWWGPNTAQVAYQARVRTVGRRAGSMEVVQADFYTVDLPGRFDVVCCWEVFGLGEDADQRRLLRRIEGDWLAPGGAVLMDVYCPFHPARDAGTEELLHPLKGVPGSVEMRERCHFDPVHCRWIDEWVPTVAPDQALAQTLRCYSPADLLLLLEGTGLALDHLEVDGETVALPDGAVGESGPLMEAWSYLVRLRRA